MKIFVGMAILTNMKYKNILVTGGAGFIGSHICIQLKKYYPDIRVTAFDNLSRKGSELNVPRLENHGVVFLKADVRFKKDLSLKDIDLIIECSAESSVMAGISSSPEYLLETNVIGAINCFELARKNNADIIFLSTSRVYPIKQLNNLLFKEDKTRFSLLDKQEIIGSSGKGISENFPLNGVRSLYGATKLSAELLLGEYTENYNMKAIINRFGLVSGPWQMGKMDQGIIAYWLAAHIYGNNLSYIGWGGEGKQVRDVLHVNDLWDLLSIQIKDMQLFSGKIYNVGGGLENSISLLELTNICKELSGNTVKIKYVPNTRAGDIRIYITDNTRIHSQTNWTPKKNVRTTVKEVYKWIIDNKESLKNVFT